MLLQDSMIPIVSGDRCAISAYCYTCTTTVHAGDGRACGLTSSWIHIDVCTHCYDSDVAVVMYMSRWRHLRLLLILISYLLHSTPSCVLCRKPYLLPLIVPAVFLPPFAPVTPLAAAVPLNAVLNKTPNATCSVLLPCVCGRTPTIFLYYSSAVFCCLLLNHL